MQGSKTACEQFLTGADRLMPTDLSTPSSSDGRGTQIPCNALVCGACGAPVLHLDGITIELGRGAVVPHLHDTLDPLGFVSAGHFHRAARAYACRCAATSVMGLTDTGRLDVKDIDHWGCGGHPPAQPRPTLRSLDEVVRPALERHLRAGGWIAWFDHALEGLGDGSARRWPFDDGERTTLTPEAVAAASAALARRSPRWIARQVAAPAFGADALYAIYLQGWKHGDLDSDAFVCVARDVATLTREIRERAQTLPRPDTIAYRYAPALRTWSGYDSYLDG